MVHVNRNELPKEELDALFSQFDTFLSKLNKGATSVFLGELLGREERITLAKRLTVIILLHEGISEYKVAKVLKLSPTTTGRIAKDMTQGTYRKTIALLSKNKRNYFAILDSIDSIIHLGGILPHRQGLERYKHLDNYSH
jgi:uncharacterized protein YerC